MSVDYKSYFKRADEAAADLKKRIGFEPKVVVVLTAGVGAFADDIEDAITIELSEVPHFPVAYAEGHKGVIICGTKNGVPLIAMKGRFHYYEGHYITDVVFPYVVFNKLGATILITTNAVGGIHHELKAGEIVLLTDHINLMGTNPLIGLAVQRDHDQFTSLSNAYDAGLQETAHAAAKACGIKLSEGVFAAVSGPTYETKAEVRMLRALGADLVGMSTVPSVIMANFLGMKVLSLSIVANAAADLHSDEPSHDEVLDAMNATGPELVELLNAIIVKLTD
jgi:purine-nucleoside phosphorylase